MKSSAAIAAVCDSEQKHFSFGFFYGIKAGSQREPVFFAKNHKNAADIGKLSAEKTFRFQPLCFSDNITVESDIEHVDADRVVPGDQVYRDAFTEELLFDIGETAFRSAEIPNKIVAGTDRDTADRSV